MSDKSLRAVLEYPHDVLCDKCGHRAIEHVGMRPCYMTPEAVISQARANALASALARLEAAEQHYQEHVDCGR